tara:strand:+ start:438 stop:1256 length:819 start_codon:yes stop_codon:yes gene_type:complete
MLEINLLFIIAILLLFTGFISGMLAGFFGLGGGIIVVPIIYHLFNSLNFSQDIAMHMAVGTSLATIIPASLNSAISHNKKNSVDKDLLNKWWLTVLIGSVFGAILAKFINGSFLLLFFAVFSFFVAIRMFYTKNYSVKTYNLLKSIQKPISFFIGALSSILGIGGGTLSVPLLVSCGRSIKKAVGTSSSIGVLISVPATIVFLITGYGVENRPDYSLGYISLIPFILISIGTLISVPLSVNIMHNVNEILIKRFFCFLLLISSLKMLKDLTF